jgi:hypothetical protein
MSSYVQVTVALVLMSLGSGASLGADLALQVSTPNGNEHRIEYRDSKSHFHIVLTNTSVKPLKIWADSNSWGYDALSFRLTYDGRTFDAKRPPAIFTLNFPRAITLAAGQAQVMDVYFGDPKEWMGFELPANGETHVSLCADFRVESSKEALEYSVWTGTISSECMRFTFVRWKQG